MMVAQFAEDLWIAEGEIVNFYGFAYPTRSVIIRLADGSLWVWSPIRLTGDLKDEVLKLGQPAHFVSPNKIHHLFLSAWHKAFPEAKLWGPRSTVGKRIDLPFETPLEDEPPLQWADRLDQVWFNGSPILDEVVFFHRTSRTVILADLSENFSDRFLNENWKPWQRWIAKRWGIVEGRGYAPLEWRLTFFDRKATRRARDRMMAWDVERVIMAHGEVQDAGGRRFLEKAFEWVG